MKIRLLLLATSLCLLAPGAFAQSKVPSLINYQGNVRNAAGVAIGAGTDGHTGGIADVALVVDQGWHLALREGTGSQEAQGRGEEQESYFHRVESVGGYWIGSVLVDGDGTLF